MGVKEHSALKAVQTNAEINMERNIDFCSKVEVWIFFFYYSILMLYFVFPFNSSHAYNGVMKITSPPTHIYIECTHY